jgi:hypothetical protein
LLHELGHWTGAESRLNRPMEGKFGSEAYAREELRAEIASLMICSELNIGHNFGQHAAYLDSWIRILKDEPFELHKASADAQKIFDFVLDIQNKLELKQDVVAKTGGNLLNKGDVIPYKNAEYRVLAVLKGKTALMVEVSTGNKFKLSPKDGLYDSLLNAPNNPVAREVEQMAYSNATKDKVEFAHQMEMAEQEQAPGRGMKR